MKLLLLSLLFFSCNVVKIVNKSETNINDDFFNPDTSSNNTPTTTPTIDTTSLDSALIDFWNLNEGSFTSRASHTGTILADVNSNTPSTVGVVGNGANCNAATNSLLRDNSSALNIALSDDITIAFFANEIQTPPPSMNWIMGTDSSLYITVDDFDSDADATDIRFEWSTAYFFYDVIPGGDTGYQHYAFLIDQNNSDISLYINGSFHSNQALSPTAFSASLFSICNEPSPGTSFYGELDSVGIWRRLLSTDEITWLSQGITHLD